MSFVVENSGVFDDIDDWQGYSNYEEKEPQQYSSRKIGIIEAGANPEQEPNRSCTNYKGVPPKHIPEKSLPQNITDNDQLIDDNG